jgi:hypothetical protein
MNFLVVLLLVREPNKIKVHLKRINRANDSWNVDLKIIVVSNLEHAVLKSALDRVEHVLNRTVNWVVWCAEDNTVTSAQDELCNGSVSMCH